MISSETDNEEIEVLLNDCYGGWVISNKARELYKLRKTENSNNYSTKRSDPILIQIYKELGDEFDGVISGVAAFGFWVETVEHKCEGLVSVKDLNQFDDFRHDEADYALVGLRTKIRFRMGDKIKIRVVAANLTKRQLDYEWVNERAVNKVNVKRKKY